MGRPSIIELEVFESAARLGSLSAAARDLGMTQQAVSARLRRLERIIGLTLMDRSPRGVTLTTDGETVLSGTHEVLAALTRLDASIAELADTTTGPLHVGASQTIAAHLLPTWLMVARRDRPGEQDVTLYTANSGSVIAMVRAHEIDLGFVECPEIPSDVSSARIGIDQMVLAVAPTHPWAQRQQVSLAEIATVPLVCREEGSGTRAAFEQAVLRVTGAPAVAPAMVFATEAAVRSAVVYDVAPAVLSRLTITDDIELGRIVAVPIGPEPVRRPLAAVWPGPSTGIGGLAKDLVETARRQQQEPVAARTA